MPSEQWTWEGKHWALLLDSGSPIIWIPRLSLWESPTGAGYAAHIGLGWWILHIAWITTVRARS